MKHKKWPLAYVFCFRIRLRRRATMPFAFATYYDPKQHLPYSGYDGRSSRKFFRSPRSQVCDSQNVIFYIKFVVLV